MADLCEFLGVPPRLGGAEDQDYYMVQDMRTAVAFYRVLSTYRSAKGEQIHRLTVGQRRTLRRLIDLGVWHG